MRGTGRGVEFAFAGSAEKRWLRLEVDDVHAGTGGKLESKAESLLKL